MTRLGRYLSPDHYKSRYNLYAGDMERTPSLSTDFMQPNMWFNGLWRKFLLKEKKINVEFYVPCVAFLLYFFSID